MPGARFRKCASPSGSVTAVWFCGPLMSTVTPGSTAPVLSTMAASMRPVDTCAADGVASASVIRTQAADAISLAIRNLIPSSRQKVSSLPRRRAFAAERHYASSAAGIARGFSCLESTGYENMLPVELGLESTKADLAVQKSGDLPGEAVEDVDQLGESHAGLRLGHEDSTGRRARRRRDGGADCRPHRQRRAEGAAPRRHERRGEGWPAASSRAQARSV